MPGNDTIWPLDCLATLRKSSARPLAASVNLHHQPSLKSQTPQQAAQSSQLEMASNNTQQSGAHGSSSTLNRRLRERRTLGGKNGTGVFQSAFQNRGRARPSAPETVAGGNYEGGDRTPQSRRHSQRRSRASAGEESEESLTPRRKSSRTGEVGENPPARQGGVVPDQLRAFGRPIPGGRPLPASPARGQPSRNEAPGGRGPGQDRRPEGERSGNQHDRGAAGAGRGAAGAGNRPAQVPLNNEERIVLERCKKHIKQLEAQNVALVNQVKELTATNSKLQATIASNADKLSPPWFLESKLIKKHRKDAVNAILKGNLWHSDIYPTETTLKNTLMAELKLDVGDPVETARFDKAWDGFLCKEFTTNFNDRRNALGDAFKRYILHENNCTVDDRREGDEECVAELKEQLLEDNLWCFNIPEQEDDVVINDAFRFAAAKTLGGENVDLTQPVLIRSDLYAYFWIKGLSAFQGSRLSNTNVYQDRLQVRDGQSRIEECAAQGRLKGVEVLQRRPGPKDVRTCHVSCYRVLKEDEEAEHELELEE